jgi:hypothetical protein
MKNNWILILFSVACFFSCVSPDGAKIAEDWKVLNKAKPVSCDLIDFDEPRGSKLTKVKHYGSSDNGVYTAHILSSSGQKLFLHKPSRNFLADSKYESLLMAYENDETVVSLSRDLRSVYIISQNFETAYLTKKNLFSQELVFRKKREEYSSGSGFFVSESNQKFSFGYYDESLRVESFNNSGEKIEMSEVIDLPFEYKSVSFEKFEELNSKLYYKISVDEGNQSIDLMMPATINGIDKTYSVSVPREHEIEEVTFDRTETRLFVGISTIDGISMNRFLQMFEIDLVNGAIKESHSQDIGNINIQGLKIYSSHPKLYLGAFVWLGDERSFALFKWGGVLDPTYYGRFEEGSSLAQFMPAAGRVNFLVSSGPKKKKNFRLCRFTL